MLSDSIQIVADADYIEWYDGCHFLNDLKMNVHHIFIGNVSFKNIRNLSCMFYGCRSLKELDGHQFAFGHCRDMRCMFEYCRDLMVLDTSGWKLSKECKANKANIIAGCQSLVLADIALLKS